MRFQEGTLALDYMSGCSGIALVGGAGSVFESYQFDKGMNYQHPIPAGSRVTLTLITVCGPNPTNSSRTHFDVERVAAVLVERLPAYDADAMPVRLQLVG